MFRGAAKVTLDDKGRMVFPTRYREFALEKSGYTATKHQREAGTGYFDQILLAISGGEAATAALVGSTEAEQFHDLRAAKS